MIKITKIKMLATGLTFSAIFLTQTVFAQKYKTAADTVKLNKEYGEVTLDIANLNADLIKQQNKTAGYESKTSSTATDATNSAQDSKTTAATATDGSMADAKKAMREARKADNAAKDSRDAKSDEADNVKKIASIKAKITKKQAILTDLAQQKAAIIGKLPTVAAAPAN